MVEPFGKSIKVVGVMVLGSPSVVLASIASEKVALRLLIEGETPVAPEPGTVLTTMGDPGTGSVGVGGLLWQMPLPESVKVLPASGTNCQS